MKIRAVTPYDLEPIILLGRAMHAKSRRAHLAFDAQGARELVAKCATEPNLCAFVAEKCGDIVGLVLGCEQRWPYIEGRFATDIVLIATYPGAGRKLRDRLVEWARERGADEVLCSVSFGGRTKATQRFYTSGGFEHCGGMFALNLRK